MKVVNKLMRREAGIALLTTILLMLLMSSLLVGFILIITSGQKLSGTNNEYSRSFYAAEAGMEKMTADLGTLFDATYSPSAAQLAVIKVAPPALVGIQYQKADGTSGYELTYPTNANGSPSATVTQIKSGPYQGMTALTTPYTLTVTARTTSGAEVKLQRTTQTVGIPMFQFGIFSDTDLSFFPGPDFNFGGRTHTNGNLFLAAGSTVTLSDRVTAVKDVIRTNLSNGWPTSSGYTGTVSITTSPGTTSYRALGTNEGSLVGTIGSAVNPNWTNISLGATNYAGNLRNGKTGAKTLNLGIVTLGSGTTQAVDVLRRPVLNESSSITAERFFSQASFRVLLSDNPQDILQLPCTDQTAPFDLSTIAAPVGQWPAAGPAAQLKTIMTNNNIAGYSTSPVPLAASGAVQGRLTYTIGDHNGYWQMNPPAGTQNPSLDAGQNYGADSGLPTIKGFLKIEVQQSPYGTPCGTWKDVTLEVLGYGYAGRNINPYNGLNASVNDAYPASTAPNSQVNPGFSLTGVNPPLLALPAGQLAPSTCPDVHPNAIIRLERVRDNPSNWAANTGGNPYLQCGIMLSGGATGTVTGYPTHPTDYWPNVLFDTREGTLRDVSPGGSLAGGTSGAVNYNGINYSQMVTLNGVMQYIEIDVKNLARYLGGALPGSGQLAYDPNVAPNDFSVYISDRRGNYASSKTWAGTWPPLSPIGHETGEYGWTDFVNLTNPATGCPNNTLDTGEDLDATSNLFVYGADATQPSQAYANGGKGYFPNNPAITGSNAVTAVVAALAGAATTSALAANPTCNVTNPTPIWPMSYVVHANEARENPNFFFRRAVKFMDGKLLTAIGTCPGAVACGLSIAAENPVYIEGDYNANSAGGGFNDPHVATSVLADSVSLLSNKWNDVNSFTSPFSTGNRAATTTYYRTAIVAGKGVSFPQPGGTAQDFGTDGGLHNFLRYVENWGGQTLNYRGSIISLFYNRQATGVYKCCTTVYDPPTRGYNFDVEFLQPQLLPPRTPLFRDVNTTGFTQLLLPQQ
jgi:Tfp pilus assembly protein PilX